MIGFVAAQGDTFEFLELTEEILDQVTPFVHFRVDGDGVGAAGMLGDHDFRAAFVQVSKYPVCIEGFIGDQRSEADAFDQRRNANRIVAMPGQKFEADQIAERIGESKNFGRQATLRLAYGLALSPPFAP